MTFLPDLTFNPVPSSARFIDEDFYIWGASMVRDPDGSCHLLYSRWPRALGPSAWVTHSEIAHAVADQPLGPYTHVDVALPTRGAAYWDGLCTHNPTVHAFEGRYFLYYMGTTGDGRAMATLNWSHRNSQRIGVAVADHPSGPWQRFDRPLIDVGGDPTDPDALMTSNPSVCHRPNGTYLLVYKAVGRKRELPRGGPVVHLAATAESPAGPFLKQKGLLFTRPGDPFPAEDPFIWVQGDRYWAIVKDMSGGFTQAGQSLALFTSETGLQWELASAPLVSGTRVEWLGRGVQELEHLERPQLWIEDGIPKVLFCAATQNWDHAFNVHIPLGRTV